MRTKFNLNNFSTLNEPKKSEHSVDRLSREYYFPFHIQQTFFISSSSSDSYFCFRSLKIQNSILSSNLCWYCCQNKDTVPSYFTKGHHKKNQNCQFVFFLNFSFINFHFISFPLFIHSLHFIPFHFLIHLISFNLIPFPLQPYMCSLAVSNMVSISSSSSELSDGGSLIHLSRSSLNTENTNKHS